jgi:hypothetical protein
VLAHHNVIGTFSGTYTQTRNGLNEQKRSENYYTNLIRNFQAVLLKIPIVIVSSAETKFFETIFTILEK